MLKQARVNPNSRVVITHRRVGNPCRLRQNRATLSFRGAAGDEESHTSVIFGARLLASLEMTRLMEIFLHPARDWLPLVFLLLASLIFSACSNKEAAEPPP